MPRATIATVRNSHYTIGGVCSDDCRADNPHYHDNDIRRPYIGKHRRQRHTRVSGFGMPFLINVVEGCDQCVARQRRDDYSTIHGITVSHNCLKHRYTPRHAANAQVAS